MVDIKDCSRPFDVNSWLSKAFEDEGGQPIEDFTEKMMHHIKSEIDITTARLNALSQEVMETTPKLLKDFDTAHEETNKLLSEMQHGRQEAEIVEQRTSLPMSKLEQMNTLRCRLLQTANALQEADKWTTLIKAVEQSLDAGDVEKSYECIIGLEKSLSFLDSNEAEERRLILEETKNQLEALATKHLINAFENSNLDRARRYYQMFLQLNRRAQFTKYFQDTEKLKISKEWRTYVELDDLKEAGDKFFSFLFQHLLDQLPWLKQIMESGECTELNILIDLYADVLQSLDPSLSFCLEIESKKESFIENLIHVNQTVHRFTQNLKGFCQSQSYSVEKITNLLTTLYSPFLPQLSKYSKHHEYLLMQKFANSPLKGKSVPEMIETVKGILPQVILAVKEAMEKVYQFNKGYAFFYFSKGVQEGLNRFGALTEEIYHALQKSNSSGDSNKTRNLLEYTLTFAELCGEILTQVETLDTALTQSFSKVYSDTSSLSCWDNYKFIYLDLDRRNEIEKHKGSLLKKACRNFKAMCEHATKLVMTIAAEPGVRILENNFNVGDNTMAIPSEYITQLGEYIMLLPQNIDPFLSSEKSALSYAFQQNTKEDAHKLPLDYILFNLCTSLCESYVGRLLKITGSLSSGQAKQIVQDIGYLESVLEDLGIKLNQDLYHIQSLMKHYEDLTQYCREQGIKIPSRLTEAVKRMKMPKN